MTDQEQAVIRAARLASASYPHLSNPNVGSDLDYYMAQLRDELEALDERPGED